MPHNGRRVPSKDLNIDKASSIPQRIWKCLVSFTAEVVTPSVITIRRIGSADPWPINFRSVSLFRITTVTLSACSELVINHRRLQYWRYRFSNQTLHRNLSASSQFCLLCNREMEIWPHLPYYAIFKDLCMCSWYGLPYCSVYFGNKRSCNGLTNFCNHKSWWGCCHHIYLKLSKYSSKNR